MMEIRHGYSAKDLHGLATHAVCTDAWRPSINFEERVDAAYCAMVGLVLSTDIAPRGRELIYAGREASNDVVAQDMRHHGVDKRSDRLGEERVNFARYWLLLADDPAHDKAIDRMALAQIWPRLSEPHQEALVALATWGDYQRAADELGLAYYTLCARVRKARLHFLRLWHEGERPSAVWGHDRRRGRETSRTAIRVLQHRRRCRSYAADRTALSSDKEVTGDG